MGMYLQTKNGHHTYGNGCNTPEPTTSRATTSQATTSQATTSQATTGPGVRVGCSVPGRNTTLIYQYEYSTDLPVGI